VEKKVDNLVDANGYCFCLLFPSSLIKFLAKLLEFSLKFQWADFTAFFDFPDHPT